MLLRSYSTKIAEAVRLPMSLLKLLLLLLLLLSLEDNSNWPTNFFSTALTVFRSKLCKKKGMKGLLPL